MFSRNLRSAGKETMAEAEVESETRNLLHN